MSDMNNLDFEVEISDNYDREADKPLEGGKRKWLGFQGGVEAIVKEIKSDGVSGPGNHMVGLYFEIQDEDCKGMEVSQRFLPVTGVGKNGPNINRFTRFFDSAYSYELGSDDAGAAKTQKLLGMTTKMSKLAPKLVGKKVALRVGFREGTVKNGPAAGQKAFYVDVKAAMLPSEYRKMVEAGQHRRPLPPNVVAWYEGLRAQRDQQKATSAAPAQSSSEILDAMDEDF